MSIMELGALGEFVGAFAVVATLIYLALQIRHNTKAMQQSQNIAIGEAYAVTGGTRVNANQALIDNADVWIKGNSGQELDTKESLVFRTLFENEATWFFTAYLEAVSTRSSAEAVYLIKDFANLLHQNPGAERLFMATAKNIIPSGNVLDIEQGPYPHFIGLVREELILQKESGD